MDDKDRTILLTLNGLLAANDRLSSAIDKTREQWPYVNRCWIDGINGEPTLLLAEHKLLSGEGTKQ